MNKKKTLTISASVALFLAGGAASSDWLANLNQSGRGLGVNDYPTR